MRQRSSKIWTALLFCGDRSGVDVEYEEALRWRRRLAETYPEDRKVQRDYSVALSVRGERLKGLGRHEIKGFRVRHRQEL